MCHLVTLARNPPPPVINPPPSRGKLPQNWSEMSKTVKNIFKNIFVEKMSRDIYENTPFPDVIWRHCRDPQSPPKVLRII
jgi:hypothetical protein